MIRFGAARHLNGDQSNVVVPAARIGHLNHGLSGGLQRLPVEHFLSQEIESQAILVMDTAKQVCAVGPT